MLQCTAKTGLHSAPLRIANEFVADVANALGFSITLFWVACHLGEGPEECNLRQR